MTEEEEELAAQIYEAIQRSSRDSERSKHAQSFKLGISDVGYCAERTRRMLDRQVPEDIDLLPAFIGTAIGDHAERAVAEHLWPHAITQAEVSLPLRLQGRSFDLPGHPDVILPGWGVWDGKTDFGLSIPERDGPSFQQQFQRHGYALAAWQAGLLGDMELSEVKVGNWWIDRGGVDRRVVVHVEHFDADVIDRGIAWLDSVIYAFLHDEEADKEPPRQVCEKTCGFFAKCREWETDVHGLIEGPHALSLDQYAEGRELERRGKRMKEEAKVHLEGMSGSNGRWQIRHTWVNGTDARKGYYKIDVKEVPSV